MTTTELWSRPTELLSTVRSSCQRVVDAAKYVTIDDSAVDAYAKTLLSAPMLSLPAKQFPLVFATAASEINFIALLAMLQFGSGYRTLLHASRGRGAYETILYGCIAMHIGGEINADRLCNVSISSVSQMFDIPIAEDYELKPAIYSQRPTKLKAFAEEIKSVMEQCGATLRALQCDDMAQFILQTRQHKSTDEKQADSSTAAALISRLLRHFPSFRDQYVLELDLPTFTSASASTSSSTSSSLPSSSVVYLLKKAQLLCSDLYMRFHIELSALNFTDINELTIFADNVIPAMLRAEKVITYTDELAKLIDSGRIINDRRMECELRAVSLIAADRIVNKYNEYRNTHPSSADSQTVSLPSSSSSSSAADQSKSTDADSVSTASNVGAPLYAAKLDYHLWLLGKREDMRKLPRHATTDTIFY